MIGLATERPRVGERGGTGGWGNMSKNQFDAIVVGSGATGGFAAKELTERGMRVLLLEAGPQHGKEEFAPLEDASKGMDMGSLSRFRAAMRGQHVQARAMFFSPQKHFLFVNDRQNPYSWDPGHFYLWVRGRQLGGRFLSFGRVIPRMSDYDFKAASRDGVGEDWPIAYQDLAPYYDQVESFLGVVGDTNHVPNMPDGKYIAKASLTSWESAFQQTVASKWPERKVIPWRYMASRAVKDYVPITIRAAQATGLVEIRTGAVVDRILIDPVTGRASGVSYLDANTRRATEVRAGVVVLCASTIESVRLMLNSACARHPNGVGNSSGVLGRYFMDQMPALVFGGVAGASGWEKGDEGFGDALNRNPGGIYIPRFQNLDRVTHPQFKRGFNIQGAVGRFVVPEGAPPLFGFSAHGEMLPRADNTVTVHPSRKDAWGIPIPHVRCTPGENELKMLRVAMDTIKEMVAASGYEIEFAASYLGIENPDDLMPHASWLARTMFRRSYRRTLGVGAAIHECGGARMGADPSKSVLNPHNQVWDAANVYVTDSSCFVTNGSCGPTLTTMALTVRACEHIAREFGR